MHFKTVMLGRFAGIVVVLVGFAGTGISEAQTVTSELPRAYWMHAMEASTGDASPAFSSRNAASAASKLADPSDAPLEAEWPAWIAALMLFASVVWINARLKQREEIVLNTERSHLKVLRGNRPRHPRR